MIGDKPPRAKHIITGPLPKLRPIDRSLRMSDEFIDFTGMRFKDVTVIGLIEEMINDSRASWLCRCVCGNHFTRKSKALKKMLINSNSPYYFCDECAERWCPFL